MRRIAMFRRIVSTVAVLGALLASATAALAQGYTKTTSSAGMTTLSGDTTIWDGSAGTYDDEAFELAIGFDFDFYGNTYDTCYVSTNGFVSFDATDADALGNVAINNTATPNRYIALFWDDLIVRNQGSVDRVSYLLSGSAPNQVLTIQYFSVSVYGDGTNSAFLYGQVKLFEGSNQVQLLYSTANNSWLSVSATIGIEDTGGNVGVGGPGTGNANSSVPTVNYLFTPSSTTITGIFKYENKLYNATGFTGSTDTKPCRYNLVVPTDAVTNAYLGTYAYADSTGAYTLSVTGCPGSVRLDVWSITPAVEVTDTAFDYYLAGFVKSVTTANVNAGTGTSYLSGVPEHASAMNICDSVSEGFDYASARTVESSIAPVWAIWESGVGDEGTTGFDGFAMYFAGSASYADEFADDVILHEYGHFLMYLLSTDDSPGGDHGWLDNIDNRLAWSEGWATFFSCAVTNKPTLTRCVPNYSFDLEGPTGNPRGADCEGAVAGILWDIRDGKNEAWDYCDGAAISPTGEDSVFLVMDDPLDGNADNDIHAFLDAWVALGYDPFAITGTFIKHGVHFDAVDEPNDAFGTGTTPKGAADFPAYAVRAGEKCTLWNMDWFRVPVADSGVQVLVDLSFTHAQGDLDLFLYNAAGSPVDSSEGTTDTETVEVPSSTAGNYFVAVFPYSGSNPSYTISYRIPIDILTTTLPQRTAGLAYQTTLSKKGGVGAVRWTLASGSLPPGISLYSDGILAGTPNSTGTFNFTVQATDYPETSTDTQALSLTVNAAPSIETLTLPAWTIGTAYSQGLTAADGTGGVTWSIPSGSLPPGLSLTPSGMTATVSGIPNSTGSYAFTVQVADSLGATASREYEIVIGDPVSVSTSSLPAWTQGRPFNQFMSAEGGVGALAWSVSAGSLPTGVTLNSSTGILSGTPAAAGTFNFTVRATDSIGGLDSNPLSWTVNPPVQVTTPTSPEWTAGRSYSNSLTATGGTTPRTWAVTSGALPSGLVLDGATGALAGAPASAGNFNVTVTVTDARGSTDSEPLSFQINAPPEIQAPGTWLFARNRLASKTFSVEEGTGPWTWSHTGVLPTGLSLQSDTGALYGTPTQTAGRFDVVFRVTDATGATSEAEATIYLADELGVGKDRAVLLSVDPSDDIHWFYFDAIERTSVKLDIELPSAADVIDRSLIVRDDDGVQHHVGRFTKKARRRLSVSKWFTPSTNRYYVGLANDIPPTYGGLVEATLVLKAPKSFGNPDRKFGTGELAFDDAANPVTLRFSALSQSIVTFTAKAVDRNLQMGLDGLLGPVGDPVDLTFVYKDISGYSVWFKNLTVQERGDFEVTLISLNDVPSFVRAKAKIKPPKDYDFRMPDPE